MPGVNAMKKHHILFAGLIVLVALLLCGAAGAEPLTIEEIKARDGNITEEELAEYLASFDDRDNGFDLAVGPNYTLDGRKIRFSQMPLTVPNSGETVLVQLVNTYYDIADDVIVVWDKEGNRFSGRPAVGTAITLDSGIHVDSGSSALAEGSKVLLIEKNGDLHAFYAGAGTNSSRLVAGKKLYIMRCFNESHFHTPNGGVDIPISFATIAFLDGSGYITAGEDGTLNINIDVDSEWEWWGFIPIAYNIYPRDCSLGISLPNLTIHMERYAGWFSVEIPLVEIVEPLAYGFAIDMSPTFSLEGVGAGDTVLSVTAREGFYLTITDLVTVHDIGWKHTDPTFDLVDTNMEGELYYGFSWGPALTWAEVAGFGGYYKTGVVLSGKKTNNGFNPDDPNDVDWHVCGTDNCLEGDAFVRQGPFSANIVLINGIISIPVISSDPWDGDPFLDYYISKTFGDKSMSSKCPHYAYRLDVQVVDQAGDSVPNVSVFYKDVPGHYEAYSSATTDGNGHAALCTATGKIVVTAELANPDDPSHPFTVSQSIEKKAAAESVILQLELPVKHVYFKNAASGEPTVWPNDMTFIPMASREVTLPDTVPKLSGRQFLSWNTAQDGSGDSYAPGVKLTLSENLTLWAQWQIAGDSWYVIYNANGGTKAPGPQIVRKGQDAILTTEEPEDEKMNFKGWSLDPQSIDPLYHPGDTLRYDSGKSQVVLYAKWELSPAERPALIAFDANGGLPDTVPNMISRPKSVWFMLPETEPIWDAQHLFLGWSDNPRANWPKYRAGAAARFEQDTTLYAIWRAQYRVISGSGSVWAKESAESLRFVANGDFRYFVELQVDGKRFMDGVDISSGSTVADIRPRALENLHVGRHIVTFVYEDGKASAPFIVREPIPKTGDQANPALWLFLTAFGMAGIAMMGIRARAAKRKQ